jgi:hypothetical protein
LGPVEVFGPVRSDSASWPVRLPIVSMIPSWILVRMRNEGEDVGKACDRICRQPTIVLAMLAVGYRALKYHVTSGLY